MAVQNNLVKKSEGRIGMTAFLNSAAVQLNVEQALGKVNKQRFVTSVISAVNTNPTLKECDNASILSAALLGESLKLSPSPQLGQFYMVPFNDKERGKVAQFQLGYKGYIQLAIRSGQYKKLNVLAIKEGELIRFDPLNEEIEVKLIDDEEAREQAETVGYYAMFEYVNGFKKAMYWSKKKMIAHADRYSQAFSANASTVKTKNGMKNKVSYADYVAGKYSTDDAWMYSSFWYKDFDGMAYKTMLRQLISKWGIMSIDMITAMDSDMAVINVDGTRDYVDATNEVIDVPEPVQADNPASDQKVTPNQPSSNADDVASALFGN